ncbi:hypothetical protein C8R44DRAFT_733891 [Mycena epipterygia]|nr:hypothetical protein C8R44DRAFT_733891 [Mycena epipterygia]
MEVAREAEKKSFLPSLGVRCGRRKLDTSQAANRSDLVIPERKSPINACANTGAEIQQYVQGGPSKDKVRARRHNGNPRAAREVGAPTGVDAFVNAASRDSRSEKYAPQKWPEPLPRAMYARREETVTQKNIWIWRRRICAPGAGEYAPGTKLCAETSEGWRFSHAVEKRRCQHVSIHPEENRSEGDLRILSGRAQPTIRSRQVRVRNHLRGENRCISTNDGAGVSGVV